LMDRALKTAKEKDFTQIKREVCNLTKKFPIYTQ